MNPKLKSANWEVRSTITYKWLRTKHNQQKSYQETSSILAGTCWKSGESERWRNGSLQRRELQTNNGRFQTSERREEGADHLQLCCTIAWKLTGGGYGSKHRTTAASPMTGSTMAVAAAWRRRERAVLLLGGEAGRWRWPVMLKLAGGSSGSKGERWAHG